MYTTKQVLYMHAQTQSHIFTVHVCYRNITDIKILSIYFQINDVDIVPRKSTPTRISILLGIGKPQILIYHISSLI